MKNEFMGIVFTDHALKRLRERRIAQSDAWYTLKHPDRQKKGKTKNSYKYSRSFGQQRIEVVAKKNDQGRWVILSVWSKMIGHNQPIFKNESKSLLGKIFKAIRGH